MCECSLMRYHLTARTRRSRECGGGSCPDRGPSATDPTRPVCAAIAAARDADGVLPNREPTDPYHLLPLC